MPDDVEIRSEASRDTLEVRGFLNGGRRKIWKITYVALNAKVEVRLNVLYQGYHFDGGRGGCNCNFHHNYILVNYNSNDSF